MEAISVSSLCSKVSVRVTYFLPKHYPESKVYGIQIYKELFFSKHGLVVSGQNKMYMAGGEYPDGSASKAVWRYDPTLDVWQEVESMQKPRSELGKFFNICLQIK